MPDNLLEGLNKEQTQAATHDAGPLMIIAGAGTGKTTVITHRIGWLIEQQKAKPDEILALTFTEKAAAEMEERVDRLLPYGYVDLWVSTFHSFCERVLKQHALDIGIPNDFTLLNEVDAWLLVRKNFDRFDLDYYRPSGNPTKFIRAILNHFSRAKDEHITPERYLAFVEELAADSDGMHAGEAVDQEEVRRLQEIANAYHTYQQLLLEHSALDFGDLIGYTLKLFQERPKILEQYRRQFRYVLVDEFQDTNWAQYELVKLLSAPENNLTVVGDDDQSIYKFRGAALSNILQFQKDYPDTSLVVLTNNYRSRQEILDASHTFIQQNNPNRLEVKLAESHLGMSKKLSAHRDGVGGVEHIHVATLQDEAAEVSRRIVQLYQEKVPLQQIAVLVRANDSAEPFIQAFERADIPFHFVALRGLYRKPVILDLLAILRMIDQPYHSQSLYRVLSHPTLGVAAKDLVRLTHASYKHGKALIDIVDETQSGAGSDVSDETRARLRDWFALFDQLRRLSQRRPASEVFVAALKQSGVLGAVQQESERVQQEQFQFLQQFYERIRRFEQTSPGGSLHQFLAELEQELQAGSEGSLSADPESGPEQVRIMTIHSSKGLEFRHVFIVNMVDRRFPTQQRKDPIPIPEALVRETVPDGDMHLEEERRLMYVAMTRAKDHVYFTSAEDYGGARKKKFSRFLHELGFGETELYPRASTMLDSPDDREQERYSHVNAHITVPSAFSYTQLAAFASCPLQYKFAHILKVPVFGRHTLSYGKTMHNTLQRFFEVLKERTVHAQTSLFETKEAVPTIPVTEDELKEMYEDAWIDEWYTSAPQRDEYRQKGWKALKEVYQDVTKEHPSPLHLEKGFTVKIDDVVVRGRIDRIDTVEGGVEIIDYKTGKPKEAAKLTKDDKRQLMIYQLAAAQCFDPPLEVKKLTFHYLDNNTRVSFLGSDEDLEGLKRDLKTSVAKIKSSDFAPAPGWHCTYCDFRDICEFRQ